MVEKASYRGWEYLSKNELHMIQSKRHLFVGWSEVALCGARPPKGMEASSSYGDEGCLRCQSIADKRGIEVN